METKVFWIIKLNHDRKGNHEVHIKIFDYQSSGPIPPKIIICIDSLREVSNLQLTANTRIIGGRSYKGIHEESNNYDWEVSRIAQAYGATPPNPLEAFLTFTEKNAISRFGDVSTVSLHYNCRFPQDSSIEVHTYLPKVAFWRYCWGCIIPSSRKKRGVGLYEVKLGEGGKVEKWDDVEVGSTPILKFINPMRKSFPIISFSYRIPERRMLFYLGVFVLGFIAHILYGIISHYLYEKLFR